MGGVVDAYDVSGLMEERHGELGTGGDGLAEQLPRSCIDREVIARNQAAHIERAIKGIDYILTVALVVGQGEAADTDGKTRVARARLERNGIILLQ